MYCTNCGEKFLGPEKFCSNCGHERKVHFDKTNHGSIFVSFKKWYSHLSVTKKQDLKIFITLSSVVLLIPLIFLAIRLIEIRVACREKASYTPAVFAEYPFGSPAYYSTGGYDKYPTKNEAISGCVSKTHLFPQHKKSSIEYNNAVAPTWPKY